MENTEEFKNRLDLEPLKEGVARMKEVISQYIVGQEKMSELILVAILSDGHILLEGVPGVAKTLSARMVARCIDATFSRIQFTPDLMPSDILGTSVFNMQTSTFEFRKGPLFGNVILIDEINRSPAKTQAALFEVMEERQISIDGTTHKLEPPYIVLATQNPIEQEGTYRLPEAQLDRFMFKIRVDYPEQEDEVVILEKHHSGKYRTEMENIEKVMSREKLAEYRDTVNRIRVEKPLLKYITDIVVKTRADDSIFLGASPRASITILIASKALAAMRGRDFVTPEDIQAIAPPALRHRLILTPEREMEGIAPDQVIQQIIKSVEVPK